MKLITVILLVALALAGCGQNETTPGSTVPYRTGELTEGGGGSGLLCTRIKEGVSSMKAACGGKLEQYARFIPAACRNALKSVNLDDCGSLPSAVRNVKTACGELAKKYGGMMSGPCKDAVDKLRGGS